MTEQQQTTGLGTVSVSVTLPTFGPADTAMEQAVLVEASWNVSYADGWHADLKNLSFQSPSAETAEEMREKFDQQMAAAFPQLRAVLKEAEAAAGRMGAVEAH